MAYRFKARSTTPGEYRLAATTLQNLVGLSDIKLGVGRGDGGTGTYNPMAAAVFPSAANVSTVETAYGPTGAEYAGALNMTLYTLISGVAAAGNVRSGVPRYTGGANGNMTLPAVGKVNSDTSYGTLGTEFTGTLNMTLYTLISGVVAAGDVQAGVSTYSGGPVGTFVVPTVAQVESGVGYGAGGTEFVGTFEGGGGGIAPGDVAAAGDVRYGVPRYVGGDNGTLVLPTEAQVELGVDFGAGGTEYTGTLLSGAGGTYPATDYVDGGVMYGPTGVEYEGTGVNATTIRTALGLAHADLDAQLEAIQSAVDAAAGVTDGIAADYQQRGVAVTLPPAPAGYGTGALTVTGQTVVICDEEEA